MQILLNSSLAHNDGSDMPGAAAGHLNVNARSSSSEDQRLWTDATVTRASLNADADLLRTMLVQVNRRINELAFVNRIPVELLSEVLQEGYFFPYRSIHAVHYGMLRVNARDSANGPMERLRQLASVCTHWWLVVTRSPQLWTRICFFDRQVISQRMLSMALRRSGDCALDISFKDCGFLSTQDQLNVLGKHSERWRSLSLHSSRMHDPQRALMPFAMHVPRLQNIETDFYIPQGQSAVLLDVRGIVGLRELKLHNGSLRWDSISFDLRSLEIYDQTGGFPTLTQLHAMLVSSFHLHTITFREITFEEPLALPDTLQRCPTVSLPFLSALRMNWVPAELTDFIIATVRTSTLYELDLDGVSDSALANGSQSDLVFFLSSALKNTRDTVKFEFNQDTGQQQILVPEQNRSYHFRVQLTFSMERSLMSDYCQRIARLLRNVEEITAVQLLVEDEWNPVPPDGLSFPAESLGDFPHVKSITLDHTHTDALNILRYLSYPTIDSLGAVHWPCPELEDLGLSSSTLTVGDMDVFYSPRWELRATKKSEGDDGQPPKLQNLYLPLSRQDAALIPASAAESVWTRLRERV